MSSTLTPSSVSPDDALCLRDAPTVADLAMQDAARFDTALSAACLELVEGRPDLLVHALWSPAEGEPLEPLGKLFGEEAINQGALSSALFRLGREGTALSAAALRLGRAVWTATVPRFGCRELGLVLRSSGIQSGGAFPVLVGERVAAVVEVLSFERLHCDLASEALAAQLTARLADVYRRTVTL